MVGSALAVAGPIVGGLIQGNAASSAADAQSASAAASVAEQRRQYDLTRQDQAPFLQTGTAANQRLAYLMGLNPAYATPSGTPGAASTVAGANNPATNSPSGTGPLSRIEWLNNPTQIGNSRDGSKGAYENYLANFATYNRGWNPDGTPNGTQTTATSSTPAVAAATDPNSDPAYGSLAKSFTLADYQADPGYAFRMSEGQKALERSQAARGNIMSGQAMKDITRFGQDTASQEYGNAYNRYNTNQTNLYNRLAGISGTGQTSANTLANTGASMANNISNTLESAGAAQAAGIVGQGNAWTTGLSNAIGGYNMNNGSSSSYSLPWQSPGNVNPAGGYY